MWGVEQFASAEKFVFTKKGALRSQGTFEKCGYFTMVASEPMNNARGARVGVVSKRNGCGLDDHNEILGRVCGTNH